MDGAVPVPELAGLAVDLELRLQDLAVVRLRADDEGDRRLPQQSHLRRLAVQAVHRNRELRMRVLAPKVQKQALGGVGLAVVLRGAVGLGNHLRHERNHVAGAGKDEAGADRPVEAGGVAAAVRLAAAAAARRRPGAGELGAVDRNKVVAGDRLHPLQAAAALEAREDLPENRSPRLRITP